MVTSGHLEALHQISRGFQGLGYVGGLLQENYEFADVLSREHPREANPPSSLCPRAPLLSKRILWCGNRQRQIWSGLYPRTPLLRRTSNP